MRATGYPDIDWEPPTRPAGPKCLRCGRFVPWSSVRWIEDAVTNEERSFGECRRCGTGEVQ